MRILTLSVVKWLVVRSSSSLLDGNASWEIEVFK